MTQHRGKRSEFSEQRRFVKELVVSTARHDRIRAEKVCLLNNDQISDALKGRFESVVVGAIAFDRGEVLTDSHGKGSLQLPDNRCEWMLAVDSAEN
jgi:hypothetical protein